MSLACKVADLRYGDLCPRCNAASGIDSCPWGDGDKCPIDVDPLPANYYEPRSAVPESEAIFCPDGTLCGKDCDPIGGCCARINAAGQEVETGGVSSHGPGPQAVTDEESTVPAPAAPSTPQPEAPTPCKYSGGTCARNYCRQTTRCQAHEALVDAYEQRKASASSASAATEAVTLAEQWKGRADDCGRLARAVLRDKQIGRGSGSARAIGMMKQNDIEGLKIAVAALFEALEWDEQQLMEKFIMNRKGKIVYGLDESDARRALEILRGID